MWVEDYDHTPSTSHEMYNQDKLGGSLTKYVLTITRKTKVHPGNVSNGISYYLYENSNCL